MRFNKNLKSKDTETEATAGATRERGRRYGNEPYAARRTSYNFITDEELARGIADAKEGMLDSRHLIGELNYYEIKRLQYEIYIDKYRFGIDREAAGVRVLENERRIFRTRLRNFRARICEAKDNRRYLRALQIKCDRGIFLNRARPAAISRNKAQLLALLKQMREINKKLSDLYDERYKDYVMVETDESLLGVGLRAARSAYRRLRDVDFMAMRYNFSAEEKARLHGYMNDYVDLSANIAVMRHRASEKASKLDRQELRAAVAEKKRERDDLENNIFLLLATVRRRTYLDSKRGVWRWVLGISIITLVLIALFGIFHEELTALLLDWATKGR